MNFVLPVERCFCRFAKKFNLSRSHTRRTLFSVDQFWDPEITNKTKKEIEAHWNEKINIFPVVKKGSEKFYLLSMFPYPSGNLHMGHVRVYTISDTIAHFLRMNGKNVIHPIGWDAFGLPAENAAIEKNIHPHLWTANNIATMKKQLKELNISFNWDTELATFEPSYYKWTQHLFLLMYHQGLAYKKKALVNWDPVDQTVLADEQVDENGCSWRSGCKVEKCRLSQWFLCTSAFSKDLYDGLNGPDLVEWRDAIDIQKHWIGECNGYTIHFKVSHKDQLLSEVLSVWTDTPELLYGATFVCISPDNHFNVPEWGGGEFSSDKQLDVQAIHPLTGATLPIFVTNALDHSPATDSCLGIPASNEENHLKFAIKHQICVTEIVDRSTNVLINSQEFSGLDLQQAKLNIVDKVKNSGVKVYQSSKKLRDWLISRQRYWGTPIPIINCPSCKAVPVPMDELPVLLPNLTGSIDKGSSLKVAKDWINVKCPRCGESATRETDTMDTFVDSSWYFLRYLDCHNSSEPFNTEKVNALMPVDLYIGGKEHASLHLFYARFVNHFLHSIGKVKHREPFIQLLMQGMVLGKSYRIKESGKYISKDDIDHSGPEPVEKNSGSALLVDWEKMSKSKFNGVDPQTVIKEHGIDTTRLFILGNVAPQSPRKWNNELFPGISKWQRRIWLTVTDFLEQKKTQNNQSQLSAEDINKYKINLFNGRNYYVKGTTHNFIITRQLSVAISKLQGLTNELRKVPKVLARDTIEFEECLAYLIIMLAPLAPHFASELWTAFCSVASGSNKYSYDLKSPVLHQKWPEVDLDYEMKINIKLNGEECDEIPILQRNLLILPKEKVIELALNREAVKDGLDGISVKHARCKQWPHFDTEVNIIFRPLGKKAKKARTAYKASSISV